MPTKIGDDPEAQGTGGQSPYEKLPHHRSAVKPPILSGSRRDNFLSDRPVSAQKEFRQIRELDLASLVVNFVDCVHGLPLDAMGGRTNLCAPQGGGHFDQPIEGRGPLTPGGPGATLAL